MRPLTRNSKFGILGFGVFLMLLFAFYYWTTKEDRQLVRRTETAPSHNPDSETDDKVKKRAKEETPFAKLRQKALTNPEPEERIDALRELADEDNLEAAMLTLMQVLRNDKEADVREAALVYLDEMEGLSFEVFRIALSDPEPSLRLKAIEIIRANDHKDNQTKDLLRSVANGDKDKEVRKGAADLLREME